MTNKTDSINPETAQKGGKRAQEERKRRRRRDPGSYEGRIKLSVNEDLLDRDNFTYRWVNDSPGRLDALTKRDDWDVVSDPSLKDDSNSEGQPIRQLVGTKEDGTALYAYLCKKPLEFHREDQARKTQRVDELEGSIMKGKHKDGASTDDQNVYVPQGGIQQTASSGGTDYKP
jgi:hypothetical protein